MTAYLLQQIQLLAHREPRPCALEESRDREPGQTERLPAITYKRGNVLSVGLSPGVLSEPELPVDPTYSIAVMVISQGENMMPLAVLKLILAVPGPYA